MNNVVEILKKGNKIHIKESQKGSFTKWCGGNVTSECIQRGKNSSNPKIRKKATFAANARKWKHEDGGCFSLLGRIVKKHQTGGKTNFFNSQAGQAVISGVTSLISTAAQNKKVQANAEAQKAQNEADWAEIEKEIIQQNQQKKNQRYQQWMSDYQSGRTMDQPSQLVAEHEGSEELNQELAEGKQGLKNKNKQIDAQADAETSGNWGNAITGILQNGLGMVGNYMANKGANNAAPSTSGGSVYKLDSFWSNPTLKTSTPTYSFNTTLTPPKTNYSFLNQ